MCLNWVEKLIGMWGALGPLFSSDPLMNTELPGHCHRHLGQSWLIALTWNVALPDQDGVQIKPGLEMEAAAAPVPFLSLPGVS